MVMVFMYTAISASNLTDVQLKHPIHSKDDIAVPGVRVDTWTGYVSMLKNRHDITATGHSWWVHARVAAGACRVAAKLPTQAVAGGASCCWHKARKLQIQLQHLGSSSPRQVHKRPNSM